MTSAVFFDISGLSYLLAMFVYIVFLASRKHAVGAAATTITIFGLAFQSIALILRWIDSYAYWMTNSPSSGMILALLRSAPLRNLYESLVFFVWCLIFIHLIVEFKYKVRSLGAFVTPLAALTLVFIDISGTSKDIQPLVPALQSNWLLFHVLLSFLGYAAFGVSFGAGLAHLTLLTESRKEAAYIFWSIIVGVFITVLVAMGLDFLNAPPAKPDEVIQSYFLKSTFKSASGGVAVISWIVSIAFIFVVWRFGLGFKKILSGLSLTTDMLEEITYKSIAVGFPLFTVGGLLMGAIWANSAWGKYWSWDPKETWSLITWFVYALYLHARFVKGWRGKKVAVLAVVGFIAVFFTYIGVNLWLSGLHAYGSE
ncbi:MAG: c-type cytochrome biogenesis protein CcsB [Nitrospirae bacterium]|nr:c-type cytochrome biogenesis protein CcsB [Nitrospirota bacterium]MBI4838200.1 c-type cytochrome biogenesis protein CcsB [Nitrospirota bacterium]